MAGASVRIDVSALVASGGDVDRELERRAIRVETRAKILCPVDEGNLRNSIAHEPGDRPLVWIVSASAAYASWIHDGERFDSRAGRIVYVRVGPRPFLEDALEAAGD